MAVVVVPESRITTWPSFTRPAAAAAIRNFSLRCSFSFSRRVGSSSAPSRAGNAPAMCAVHQSVGVQNLQIFADRDLGSIEFPGHVRDQYTAILIQDLDNGPPAFFVEHVSSANRKPEQLMIALSFYIVCFRLSSRKRRGLSAPLSGNIGDEQ